jgi:hypothetical protein
MMTARRESFPVSADNAVRKLLAASKTWKAYAESIPSAGYLGAMRLVRTVPRSKTTNCFVIAFDESNTDKTNGGG